MRKRAAAFILAMACTASAVSCGAKEEKSKDSGEASVESSTSAEAIENTTEEATEPATEKEKKSVKHYEKRHFSASGSILYREDYFYNDDDQLDHYQLWNAFDGSTVTVMLYIEYEYDDSGKLIKSTRHFTDNKDGQALMYYLEEKEGFYKYGFGYGNTREEEDGYYYSVDEYNDEGWITSTKRYSTSGGDTLLSEVVYEYEQENENPNGAKKIEVNSFVKDANGDTSGSTTERFTIRNNELDEHRIWYYESKCMYNSIFIKHFNNDGTLAYSTEGTYGKNGDMREGEAYETRYTFDEYDNILTEKKYLITGKDQETTTLAAKVGKVGGSSSNSSTEETTQPPTTQPPKMTLPDIDEYGTLDSYVEYKYEYR